MKQDGFWDEMRQRGAENDAIDVVRYQVRVIWEQKYGESHKEIQEIILDVLGVDDPMKYKKSKNRVYMKNYVKRGEKVY